MSMAKRLCSALLTLCLLLSLAGCASIFDGPYYVVTDYVDEAAAGGDEVGSIRNYSGLRRAVNALVVRHEDQGQLKFQNYSGSISDDLAQVCWEIKSNTALGAYSVDYMSYDLSRIVSYYEADLFITYKRTREQVDAIVSVENSLSVNRALQPCMAAMEPMLTLSLSTAMLDADGIRENVAQLYYGNPLLCVILPAVTVAIYQDTGMQKIFELSFDYGGMDADALAERKAQLMETAADWAYEAGSPSAQDAVLAYGARLAERCVYDPEIVSGYGGDPLGATAYGALVGGAADSEGFAMAFSALCVAAAIDCTVVSGRRNNEEHFWNIVTLGDNSYHVDCSVWAEDSGVHLKSDADMSGDYWWDVSKYPSCEQSVPVAAAEAPASES